MLNFAASFRTKGIYTTQNNNKLQPNTNKNQQTATKHKHKAKANTTQKRIATQALTTIFQHKQQTQKNIYSLWQT
ncbi:MAG: hypothetical protein MJZ36_01105 [Bacteroidaceae bacterium]|nr:hypothetical protein [Bacteroidaceae bacterium]